MGFFIVDFRLRIHLHTESSREDIINLQHLLSSSLSSFDDHVFTIQEVLSIAQNIVSQLDQLSSS